MAQLAPGRRGVVDVAHFAVHDRGAIGAPPSATPRRRARRLATRSTRGPSQQDDVAVTPGPVRVTDPTLLDQTLPTTAPVAPTPSFAMDSAKLARWAAFARKTGLAEPAELEEVGYATAEFLLPSWRPPTGVVRALGARSVEKAHRSP